MDWGVFYDTVWGIAGVVLGVGSVVAMVVIGIRSHRERNDEIAAREFYSEHGHWPDQEPGAPPDPLPPVR